MADRAKKRPSERIFPFRCWHAGIALAIAIVLPPILLYYRTPFLALYHANGADALVKLFAGIASVLFILISIPELKRRWGGDWRDAVPVLVPLLVILIFLGFLYQFKGKSYDYLCYEYGASAIQEGENAYGGEHAYLYPPMLAQSLHRMYRSVNWIAYIAGVGQKYPGWDLVFYLFQCGQLIALMLAYYLSAKLLREARLRDEYIPILAGLVMVFNFPLIMSLKLNQVNIWVMVLMLVGVIYSQRNKFIAGLAVAIGGHIKLYPLVLIVPWIIRRQYKTVLALIISTIAIILLLGILPENRIWNDFVNYASANELNFIPRSHGLHSMIFWIIQRFIPEDASGMTTILAAVFFPLTLGVIAWFGIRIYRREKSWPGQLKKFRTGSKHPGNFIRISHAMDIIAMVLIISPTTWYHHYVLFIPVFLWIFAISRGKDRWTNGLLGLLIFCIPPMHLIPLKFIRIFAIIVLMVRNRMLEYNIPAIPPKDAVVHRAKEGW